LSLLTKNFQSVFNSIGGSSRESIIEQNIDFASLSEQLQPIRILQEFFNVPLKGRIIGIIEDLLPERWKGLATQWSVWENCGLCQLKFDRQSVVYLLSSSLGEQVDDTNFSCHSMTDLEKQIMEGAIQALIDHFTENLSQVPLNQASISGQTVNVVWAFEAGNEMGKLVLSMPFEALPVNYAQAQNTYVRTEHECLDASILVSLQVGTSDLTLKDIVSFEVEDFLLLEHSDKNYFTILGKDNLNYAIPVYVGPRKNTSKWHKINLDDNDIEQVKENMNQVLGSEVLGDFPVEIKAEFKDVKMTLKDLFSLQSGWVLPLDQVVENELILTSQGKTIAKGELVVAGNKFGIMIKEVLLNSPKL
jgi:flagellar motor switch protein FliN/FliY